MIDCHNHILPGIDDGAHDLEMATAMAQVAVASGIDTIVCTPHHMNGVYTNPRDEVLQAVEQLQHAFNQENIALTLVPGSELHLVPEIPDMVAAGRALTYGDHGTAALVELPTRTVPSGTIDHLKHLIKKGITPVIAHPERNAALAATPQILLEWVAAGCATQLTAQSVSGEFGAAIRRVCDYWISEQCAHIVASDAHRPRGRKPNLTPALERVATMYGEDVATALFITNPGHLITGTPLETAPKPRASVGNTLTRMRGKVGWL